jgi:hypothetical protein
MILKKCLLKNKLYFILISITIVFFIFNSGMDQQDATAQINNELKIWTDDRLGISVEVPKNWFVYEIVENENNLFTANEDIVTFSPHASIDVFNGRYGPSVTITIHYLSNEDVDIDKTYPAFKKLLVEPFSGDRSSSSLESSISSNLKDGSTENPSSTTDPLSSTGDILSSLNNPSSTTNTDVYNITTGPEKITLANQSAYSVMYEKKKSSGDDLSLNTQKYQSTLVKIPGFEIYELRYEARADQFDHYFPIAKQIINSFNFVR